MSLSKEAQRVLVKAAELINIKGRWIKGEYNCAYYNINDERIDTYCAIGAVNLANTMVGTSRGTRDAVMLALRRNLPLNQYNVEAYNDHRLTSYEDIKALFCRTLTAELDPDTTTAASAAKDNANDTE